MKTIGTEEDQPETTYSYYRNGLIQGEVANNGVESTKKLHVGERTLRQQTTIHSGLRIKAGFLQISLRRVIGSRRLTEVT